MWCQKYQCHILFDGFGGDNRVNFRVIFVKICEEFDWCD